MDSETNPVDLTAELNAELSVEIWPGHSVFWRGTRAQLEAEPWFPRGNFEWPEWRRWAEWKDEKGTGFRLFRHKPPGFKGHVRDWNAIDYWQVVQDVPTRRVFHSKGERLVFEAKQRLWEAQWLASPEGQKHAKATSAASDDTTFQAFLIHAGAKKPRKPRASRKSSEATSS